MSRRQIREAVQSALAGNLVDRVIGYVAPIHAAKRARARMFMALAGGYTGGARGRRQTSEWSTTRAGSADADQLPDLQVLRDRSRDLVRNEPLACGAIAGVTTSVIGTGLALQSRIDHAALGMTEEAAEEWQEKAEREFNFWAESTACDATRTQNFYGLQDLVLRSTLESGDVFVTMPMREIKGMPYQLCLQIFEADQVSNPNGKADTNTIAGGVEMDSFRAPVAYHFQRTHPGAVQRSVREWDRIPAFGEKTGRRQVIHFFDKLRPGQTRGMPYLAPVIESMKMLGRYSEAELMAAVISSMFTAFVTSERGGLAPADPSGMGGETGAQASDKDIKMAPGAILDLAPGEKVEIANPGRPNPQFNAFVEALCRLIGIALELPYEVLIKHFTASYSASRGALLEAWKFYKKRRALIARGFCDPVYEAFMDEAVATARIAAPGYFADPYIRRAYLGAEWVGDGPISVDPVKDVEAAKGRIELRISTLQKESALHDGGDWKDNIRQRAREEKEAIHQGLLPAPAPAAAGNPPAKPADPNSPDNADNADSTDTETP